MILVFGKNGQLAQSLREQRWPVEIRFLGSQEVDLSIPGSCEKVLDDLRPRWVINAAAYTTVDKAETEKEKAYALNARFPADLADWCKNNEALLTHFSTDYVFSGEGASPRYETDPVGPINEYGRSKELGEAAIAELKAPCLLFRVSWVYSNYGQNFVKTMLRLGEERETIQVVDDQVGSPMSAVAIARLVNRILANDMKRTNSFEKTLISLAERAGIYHLSSSPFVSWHGFAEEIFRQAREMDFPLKVQKVEPISTRQYPTPAQRPLNSRMSDEKFRRVFGFGLEPWKTSLKEVLSRLR